MIAAFWTALGFIKSNWKAILAVIVVAPAIFLLGQCDGKRIGRQQMETAIAVANAETLKQTNIANEAAAKQRLTDTVAVNRQEQELLHEIAQTPDSAPDAVRVQLSCARLRRANGASAAAIPACAGPRR